MFLSRKFWAWATFEQSLLSHTWERKRIVLIHWESLFWDASKSTSDTLTVLTTVYLNNATQCPNKSKSEVGDPGAALKAVFRALMPRTAEAAPRHHSLTPREFASFPTPAFCTSQLAGLPPRAIALAFVVKDDQQFIFFHLKRMIRRPNLPKLLSSSDLRSFAGLGMGRRWRFPSSRSVSASFMRSKTWIWCAFFRWEGTGGDGSEPKLSWSWRSEASCGCSRQVMYQGEIFALLGHNGAGSDAS